MTEDSEIWEKIHASRSWGKYPNEELVRFIGRNFFNLPLQKRKNIKILELGCGQGSNLWFLAIEGFKVSGVDISLSALEKAKERLKKWNIISINLKKEDIRNLTYADASFDVVIDISTVWCVSYSDHKKVYKEVKRILKPNGVFWSFHIAEGSWGESSGKIIDYKTLDNITEGPLKGQGTVFMPSDQDIRKLLINSGFTDIKIERNIRTYNEQSNKLIHWIIEAR